MTKKIRICKQDSASEQSTKIFTRKELVMMETKISNFHTSFYIPDIQKLVLHIPHVQILGTSHCGYSHQTTFNPQPFLKMCYVAVIMLRRQLLLFPIK